MNSLTAFVELSKRTEGCGLAFFFSVVALASLITAALAATRCARRPTALASNRRGKRRKNR